jgi:hypothetical protein
MSSTSLVRHFSTVTAMMADFRERKRWHFCVAGETLSTVTAMLVDFGDRKRERPLTLPASETLFGRYGHFGGLLRAQAQAATDMSASLAGRGHF